MLRPPNLRAGQPRVPADPQHVWAVLKVYAVLSAFVGRAVANRYWQPATAGPGTGAWSELFRETPTGPVPVYAVRQIFARFWPYARPYRHRLLLGLVFVATGPVLDAASIWLFKLLIDDVLTPRDFGAFPLIAIAYVAITLLTGVTSYIDRVLAVSTGERFLSDLRTSVYYHVHGLSMDFFDSRRLGDLLSRFTSDMAAIEAVVVSGITRSVSLGLRILLYGAALFYLQWQLAGLALVVAPLFWAMSRLFARHLKEASRENRRTLGGLTSVAEESLANVALVQAYNRRELEVARFRERSLAVLQSQLRTARLRGLYTPIGDLFELIGLLIVIGLGTWQLTNNRLTMGELLVFMAYFGQLASPLRGVGRLSNSLASASASAERIVELIDTQPTVAQGSSEPEAARIWGKIALDNVTFRYPGSERDVLRGISATIEPGQILAVVGESGAGKSSVAKLLLRFYDASSGAIRLDGRDLREWSLPNLRDNVAVVLQETMVFDGTIRDNIMWARPEATPADFDRAARGADLQSVVANFPDGYDTRVGQRGRRLSGGQRQRVAIARAMLRDAPVLLLDEPTTGLDAETTLRVMGPLRRLMRGRTTIIITHNLTSIRDADLILVLDGGRVIERGTHSQLLTLGGAYARLYPGGEPRTVPAPPPERWWASGPWWQPPAQTGGSIDLSRSGSGGQTHRGWSVPSSLFGTGADRGRALQQRTGHVDGRSAPDPESGTWWS